MSSAWPGLIEAYRDFLPVTAATPVVTLREGNTPLVPAPRISALVGERVQVWLKYEGANPTGSFKDRGMTLAISKAVEEGSRVVMCASTGNTSASAAAYSARAGLRCVVLIPQGGIAMGKLAQALIHRATVLAVEGNFDDALQLVRDITAEYPVTLVNSVNPFRIEGQTTAAYEICDALGGAPDILAIPVGNAGNITAYWRGFKRYQERGRVDRVPRMFGFQAEGAAPIVRKMVVTNPQTIATAIKIGNPASWQAAEAARDESGGCIDMVSDEEILAAYKVLACQEGVFAEPASAASVAGILKLANAGYFTDKGPMTVVCVLTGHGLKDPDRAMKSIAEPAVVPPTREAVLKAAGL